MWPRVLQRLQGRYLIGLSVFFVAIFIGIEVGQERPMVFAQNNYPLGGFRTGNPDDFAPDPESEFVKKINTKEFVFYARPEPSKYVNIQFRFSCPSVCPRVQLELLTDPGTLSPSYLLSDHRLDELKRFPLLSGGLLMYQETIQFESLAAVINSDAIVVTEPVIAASLGISHDRIRYLDSEKAIDQYPVIVSRYFPLRETYGWKLVEKKFPLENAQLKDGLLQFRISTAENSGILVHKPIIKFSN